MKKLQGKWALITGSSRGIGQQIALGLSQHGCNCIIHGRKIEHTEKTVKLLAPYDVKIKTVAGDFATEQGVESVIRAVMSEVGHIDILYNNAGIQNDFIDVWTISLSEWKSLFQINLFSIVQLCNAFIPTMVQRGWGRVINTSSGIQDVPQLTPYSVSKAAIDKLCLDLAAQLKETKVLVNALDPGWLRTDLGGPEAEYDVETVLPGALAPLLTENQIPNGASYHAHTFKNL
ncbi:MAG: SDR family oxidoreductase [Chitinivibrionales bacterium]|nr:SDR family oxidoreductase [Chitinivibrionales bacterium]